MEATIRSAVRRDRVVAAALAVWFLVIATVAFIAIRDHWHQLQAVLRPYPTRTDEARITLALFVAAFLLVSALGLLRPTWRRRAFVLLAALPLPILAVTSGNVTALASAAGLLTITGWLGNGAATWLLRPRYRSESWIIG